MEVEGKNIIELLPEILQLGKVKAEKIIQDPRNIMDDKESIVNMDKKEAKNYLYHGDNLDCIESLICQGYKEKIDLIYIDPPFLTMANYKSKIELLNGDSLNTIESVAYDDKWKGGMKEYLEMMSIRLYLMKELLSSKGSIYVHLDYRIVHYVKILMDYIFGEENFINEIIWSYKSGGVTSKYYSRKHDTILMYSKTEDYIFNPQKEKSYNREFKPYRFKGVKEYEDKIGWYTLVNLKDVWNINIVGRSSGERVGYGTQKPEELLERIISTSSNKDSIVADFFAGSGTTGVVAEKLGRRYIMGDKGQISILTIMKRIAENKGGTYNLKGSKGTKAISKLKIDSIEKEKIKDDKYLLKIKLGKYKLDLNMIKLNKKDKLIVSKILSKDSFALIDYIALDLNYDGKIPNIRYEDYRKKDYNKVDNEISVILDKSLEDHYIYLKAIDVFGNEYREILKI